MKKVEPNDKNGVRYMGMSCQSAIDSLPIKLNDSLMFCDLRSCIFDGYDLSMVEFLGCRLNGTSFQGANLLETRFIGCFSSDYGPPTDFRDSQFKDVFVVDCHLNCIPNQKGSNLWHWPTEIADAASGTLSDRNDVRYNAARKLGALDNPVVAPILGCLLIDNEWEVRSVSLKVMGELRQRHVEFPHSDKVLMEWMFLCLGDESAFVRSTAAELVKLLSPSDDILLVSIDRIRANSKEERLAGLRAATELCRLDAKYSRLLDLQALHTLLSDESPEIRSATLYLLGILDNPTTIPWIVRALSDPVASIRVDALLAISWLSEPPSASHLTQLLNDPDEQVRIQVLNTLEEIGDFDPKEVEAALSDPSPEVRRLAKRLLEGA